LLLIGYCAYRFFKGRARKDLPPVNAPREKETETFKDPVCGLYVSGDDAVVGRLSGEKIYFCSMACLEKYREKLGNN
jgi:YHS domain-containing protein